MGESKNVGITHIFPINPNTFKNPKSSFQYSLGDSHGSQPSITSSFLIDDKGEHIVCMRTFLSCRYFILMHFHTNLTAGCGLKVCSAHGKFFLVGILF
jgi:hypothetical protein